MILTGANLSDTTNYYLGVDGGGSKTKAVLVSMETPKKHARNSCQCLLGEATLAGSNPLTVGWEVAYERIAEVIKLAKQAARLTPESKPIQKGVLAIAGAANPEAMQRLTSWASKQGFAEAIDVVADTAPLLANVLAEEPAIGVIAGTGSVVLVQDLSGATTTVGGWGYLIDDAGSGYAIGRRALREVVRSTDREDRKEPLTSTLLQALAIDSTTQLKQSIYSVADPRRTIASLAEAIVRLAEKEDPSALRLLEVEANLLANEIGIGWDRLTGEQSSANEFVLYVGGSLLQRSNTYRKVLEQAVKQQGLPLKATRLAPDGACGCALLASHVC